MTPHRTTLHVLLLLQQAATPQAAEALIADLADPLLRRQARREWQRLHETQVTRIEMA
jgi:hypothetical protein